MVPIRIYPGEIPLFLIDEGTVDNGQHAYNVCIIFETLFFTGFVSGDDPASARNALVSTHGQYPPLCDVSVCAFVFPPLLASLISLYPVSPMPYTHVMTGDPWRKSNLIIYTIIGNEKESIRFTENREGIRK